MIFLALLIGIPAALWLAIVAAGGSVRWDHEADAFMRDRS